MRKLRRLRSMRRDRAPSLLDVAHQWRGRNHRTPARNGNRPKGTLIGVANHCCTAAHAYPLPELQGAPGPDRGRVAAFQRQPSGSPGPTTIYDANPMVCANCRAASRGESLSLRSLNAQADPEDHWGWPGRTGDSGRLPASRVPPAAFASAAESLGRHRLVADSDWPPFWVGD